LHESANADFSSENIVVYQRTSRLARARAFLVLTLFNVSCENRFIWKKGANKSWWRIPYEGVKAFSALTTELVPLPLAAAFRIVRVRVMELQAPLVLNEVRKWAVLNMWSCDLQSVSECIGGITTHLVCVSLGPHVLEKCGIGKRSSLTMQAWHDLLSRLRQDGLLHEPPPPQKANAFGIYVGSPRMPSRVPPSNFPMPAVDHVLGVDFEGSPPVMVTVGVDV